MKSSFLRRLSSSLCSLSIRLYTPLSCPYESDDRIFERLAVFDRYFSQASHRVRVQTETQVRVLDGSDFVLHLAPSYLERGEISGSSVVLVLLFGVLEFALVGLDLEQTRDLL